MEGFASACVEAWRDLIKGVEQEMRVGGHGRPKPVALCRLVSIVDGPAAGDGSPAPNGNFTWECDITTMRVGVKTDIGRTRRSNEDAYWASPPWFVVADGVGGHAAGEVASSLAIEAVRSAVEEGGAPAEVLVMNAIRTANNMIWERSQKETALAGMGTTLTMAYIESDHCIIGHVGDSRCYLWRENELRQLTQDHSVVGELVRSGMLTAGEAFFHPQRNLLTQALGVGPHIKPDITLETLRPGDKIILCTDGLTDVLTDDELQAILQEQADPQTLAERLVHEANSRGGPDNITAVVVEMPCE